MAARGLHPRFDRRWLLHAKILQVEAMKPAPIPRTLLVCLLGMLSCLRVPADTQHRTLFQLQHTGWTAREGAPGSIQSLAQTTDGYMWLGTVYGLFRFDGVHFDRYKPPSGEKLNSENVSSLMSTSDGGLWIGFQYGNVAFMKDARILSYGESEGLPPGTVYGFTVDWEGAVWAAANGGLARLEGSRWRRIGEDWAYPGKSAKAVFVDRDGTLWVASEDTVVFLPRGQRVFKKTGEHSGRKVYQIAQAPDGTLWMTERGSAVVRPITVPGRENSQPSPIDVKAFRLLFDRARSFWISGGDGIYRVSFSDRLKGQKLAQYSQKPEIFTQRDGLTSNYADPILEDREGNIWVGTNSGLDRFRESNLVPVPLPKGAGDYGMKLVGGYPGAVLAVRHTGRNELSVMDIRSTVTTVHGVASGVRCAYRDADGNIWLGGVGGGLWRLSSRRVVRIPLPEEIRNSDIQAITKDRSGGFWVSIIRNGVFRWANGVWTPFGNRTELPKLSPLTLLTDSAGRVWFGYMGSTIAVLDGGTLKTFSSESGLDVVNIEAIYEHAGHIWAGGERGLAVLQGSRFQSLTTDGDIELKGISGIVETSGGDLWLNAAPGIIHIPATEVRRALENPDRHVQCELFDFRDGLPGTARPLEVPSALASSDGKLWFMLNNSSAVQIDPQHLSRNAIPPPVFVRSLDSEGREYPLTSDLKLPVRTTRVHIEYTALNFSVPERVRFRYKLEGADKDWQDVGTRREAFYTNLRPGSYRFHVIACNNDGVWNEEGAALQFNILPAFYQTNWFFLLCVTAAGWLAWTAYRWRLRQMVARLDLQFRERLSERTRVAQDLHDTLLQDVLSASLQLQVAEARLPADSPAKPIMGEVLTLMRSAIEGGRKAVRSLRSSQEETGDLTHAFSRIPQELAMPAEVGYRVTVEGQPRSLHPLVRDEVYRIGREALVNAFRHSGARTIEVELDYATEQLRILVCDDGCGIDPHVLREGRQGHWGLSGMRERAEGIGAKLKVLSRAAGGTEVELSVPNDVAFRSYSPDRFGWLARRHPRQAEPSVHGQPNERKS
jgi:signal transduction histidine kinase/ligand-binding sensor domain-containing protein